MSRRTRNTTRAGLGWAHQQQVERLRRSHIDGSPCYWCGQPLYRDKTRNWDGRSLHGDHTLARSHGGRVADRLLHHTCNSQRGDGNRDDERPALGEHAPPQQSPLGELIMGWPAMP